MSIRQQNTCVATTKNDICITCMMMINPSSGWFLIMKVTTFDLDEVASGNDAYIDNSSARESHLLKKNMYIQIPASAQSCV